MYKIQGMFFWNKLARKQKADCLLWYPPELTLSGTYWFGLNSGGNEPLIIDKVGTGINVFVLYPRLMIERQVSLPYN